MAIFLLIIIASLTSLSSSTTFKITNNCGYMVWPGILSGAGTAPLPTTGFVLETGESKFIQIPTGWSGRFWGRTHCSTDDTGKFACATGDCGSSTLECSGSGATPPATLAEFTLDGSNGLDFYDVSLVDGYNLPMLVVPLGGSGSNCSATGCLVDLNGLCPSDLKVKSSDSDLNVACRSACEAFGTAEYCCSGEYGNPNTCKPTAYSQVFKNACPRAYSYAYDDRTSTFTCSGSGGYEITFCASGVESRKKESEPGAAGLPVISETMVFLSGDEVSSDAASRGEHPLIFVSCFAFVLVLWGLIGRL